MGKDIAVVTGASGGIGQAVARHIHERSGGELRLALHYNGGRAAAEALCAAIPGSFLVRADLATAGGRAALLAKVLERGTPYVLVNNAGIDRPHEPALQIEETSFDALVALNLKAPVLLMRDFGREMAASGSGVIVNVSSVLARVALVGSAVYRATKAALEEMTRQFAFELGPRGVRVNAVAPGFIETSMTAEIAPELRRKILAQVAVGDFGAPEAVALAVGHLIENDFANGSILHVDGGMAL